MQLARSSLSQFARVVVRVGLTSFGGGVSGWMMRIVVEERRWMTEGEFLTGLALCQVLPGINVVNLAIWLGYRLHGGAGALVGGLAMVVPPGAVALALLVLLAGPMAYPSVGVALDGVAAAAIGLGASMGLRAVQRCRGVVPLGLAAVTFIGIGVLHWPMLAVLAPVVPLSLAYAWFHA